MATIDWMNTSRADVTGSLYFSDPKTTSNGMKLIDLAFNGKQVALQTPQLIAPFGASDKFEAGKFKLLLRLAPTKPGEFEKARVGQFIRMLEAIDQTVVEYVFQNQEVVLGVSGKSRAIIADKYSPLVKVKEGREPAIDLKFNTTFEVYDKDKQMKKLEDITPGSLTVCLVKLSGIWANTKGFGVLAKCVQVMTTPGVAEKKISDFAIVDMEE